MNVGETSNKYDHDISSFGAMVNYNFGALYLELRPRLQQTRIVKTSSKPCTCGVFESLHVSFVEAE